MHVYRHLREWDGIICAQLTVIILVWLHCAEGHLVLSVCERHEQDKRYYTLPLRFSNLSLLFRRARKSVNCFSVCDFLWFSIYGEKDSRCDQHKTSDCTDYAGPSNVNFFWWFISDFFTHLNGKQYHGDCHHNDCGMKRGITSNYCAIMMVLLSAQIVA